jgi:hypothetical protein
VSDLAHHEPPGQQNAGRADPYAPEGRFRSLRTQQRAYALRETIPLSTPPRRQYLRSNWETRTS